MRNININFTDFWGGFNKTDNYFYNLLKEEFDVRISNNPDYLFFSIFGNEHLKYNCKKIFFTGENIEPPMEYCDWSFSFDKLDDNKNYRLPLYLMYDGYYDLVNKKIDEEKLVNRKFCNFIVSNGSCDLRNNFFKKLSKYKKVDSGGRWMNNIGYAVDNKVKFQSEYKFSIAFENNAYRPGYKWYVTEKIMEPMTVNSIPLYRGASGINEDFNTKSFVNYHDFNSEDDMIDYIIELDKDNSKYIEMLNNPWFIENEIPESNKIENIKKFLFNIF